MGDLLNGQVVAALSQWHGAVSIAVSLAVGYTLRRIRIRCGVPARE